MNTAQVNFKTRSLLLTDWSTLNVEAISRLTVYTLPPTYHLQDDPGNGCFLDPPGYPTYFTYSIYTQNGNSPARSPSEGIWYPENTEEVLRVGRTLWVTRHAQDWSVRWEEQQGKYNALMRRLWRPLPLDHPRTRAWIASVYIHHQHCYFWPLDHHIPSRDGAVDKHDTNDIVIWPVPGYRLLHFHDDPRFSDEWRAIETARVEAFNREVIEATRPLATPDNHMAVRLIQQFYPEYEPETELIEHVPEHPGTWWERFAKRPSPLECPGAFAKMPHPSNGRWCQLCGWHPEEDDEAEDKNGAIKEVETNGVQDKSGENQRQRDGN